MEKIKTTVRIGGKEYTISGYDSSEHVQRVAQWVDRRMTELSAATHLPPAQLSVLTALNAADDMMKSREEIRHYKRLLAEMQDKAGERTYDEKA